MTSSATGDASSPNGGTSSPPPGGSGFTSPGSDASPGSIPVSGGSAPFDPLGSGGSPDGPPAHDGSSVGSSGDGGSGGSVGLTAVELSRRSGPSVAERRLRWRAGLWTSAIGSHLNVRAAMTTPTTPQATTMARLSQRNPGGSTVGLNGAWMLSTNGRSGRALETTSSHLGIADSSTAMNVLEMNAIGRMIALVTAGAASWLRMRPAIATPRAENASVPTMNVTTSAGTLASSISRS